MNTVSVEEIATILKKNVDAKKLVDIDAGIEELFGASKPKFRAALDILRKEGYQVVIRITTQAGTGKKSAMKILATPKANYKDVYDYKIHPIETDMHD